MCPAEREYNGTNLAKEVEMSEQDKAVVRSAYEAFEKGPAAMDEVLASNFVAHAPGGPVPLDREAFKQFRGMLYAGFPDLKHTIEDLVAEGDKVASRFTGRGTHRGEFMGIRPTGKSITLTGLIIGRVAGGKLAEQWFEFDSAGLLGQLGAIPAPSAS